MALRNAHNRRSVSISCLFINMIMIIVIGLEKSQRNVFFRSSERFQFQTMRRHVNLIKKNMGFEEKSPFKSFLLVSVYCQEANVSNYPVKNI